VGNAVGQLASMVDIERAFSPYSQIDSKLSRAHHGTGLGLPISRALAQLQGGDVKGQSHPGQGTRMSLLLPETRILREEIPAASLQRA
jgi:two-component system cell cycle sensor histidine kinase PleC